MALEEIDNKIFIALTYYYKVIFKELVDLICNFKYILNHDMLNFLAKKSFKVIS